MRLLLAVLSVAFATPAAAEVVKAEPGGFEIATTITIDAPAQVVWDTLRAPARWWSKDHTWSGDAANLYLDPQATGCFCEKLPGSTRGSVEHAHVIFAQPLKLLRLRGALGPLQEEAVIGTLTFELTPEGSGASKVALRYVVGGYVRGGAEAMAPVVDRVLTEQLEGLKAAALAPPPTAG